ncbi:MAG: hypothetical protein JSU63_02440 [Phycisphaerales bacterium]|nr:MAG: hypothetical protein JSU63_02440 [Phycisphaerales bacterium]
MNLIIATGLCYGIWWRVDQFMYLRLIYTARVMDESDLDKVATQMFGIPPETRDTTPDASSSGAVLPGESMKTDEAPRIVGETAQQVIVVSAYGWLTLATIACCAVALCGGAALGRAGGRLARVIGVLFACGCLLILWWAAYGVWAEHGMAFRPTQLRVGMSALVLLTALVGLAIGRGVRGLTRLAGVLLILSALGSVAGLYLGAQCGALHPEQSSYVFMAIVFIAHSAWGWILLPVATRVRR